MRTNIFFHIWTWRAKKVRASLDSSDYSFSSIILRYIGENTIYFTMGFLKWFSYSTLIAYYTPWWSSYVCSFTSFVYNIKWSLLVITYSNLFHFQQVNNYSFPCAFIISHIYINVSSKTSQFLISLDCNLLDIVKESYFLRIRFISTDRLEWRID